MPECLGWPKTSEYDQTDKDLKSKSVKGKKFIYQPMISIKKENFNSKPKNKSGLKKTYFFGSP